MLPLDRSSPTPLYHQLKQVLLANIQNKDFMLGELLPTEIVLMEQYDVSRATVRRAMADLEQEGYIDRRQGKGTFATEPKINRGLTRLTSFSEDRKEKGLASSSKILDFRQKPASPQVAKKLGIEAGAPLWFIQRLRLDAQQSVAINLSYLHLPPPITIAIQELEETGSLWALLESKGIVLAEADRTIEAITADPIYAEQLQVQVGAPLLLVKGVVYDRNHTPVEYHQVINRGDRYQYTLHLKR